MQTDQIRKTAVLRAPLARVWAAISDSSQFGQWFGVSFDGPFVAGERLRGRIVPTQVDPDVAKMQEPWAGTPFGILVERIEPMRLFSFRWHPGCDPGANPPDDEMTNVTFELEERPDGVLLTITESGFDRIPLARRAQAFTGNEGGWQMQTQLIAKFLARSADG